MEDITRIDAENLLKKKLEEWYDKKTPWHLVDALITQLEEPPTRLKEWSDADLVTELKIYADVKYKILPPEREKQTITRVEAVKQYTEAMGDAFDGMTRGDLLEKLMDDLFIPEDNQEIADVIESYTDKETTIQD